MKNISIIHKFNNKLTILTVGSITLYFSYSTIVAIKDAKINQLYCITNLWSRTTGRHLNFIQPDHKLRLNEEGFNKILEQYLDNGFNFKLF